MNKHVCSDSKDINKHNHKEDTDTRVSKDMAHYLTRGINKGSKEEIEMRIEASKDKSDEKQLQITKSINNPKYIIYDFEADTSTGVHKPNLCIVNVLEIDDAHNYEKSLISSHIFEGYNCLQDFCLWLLAPECT
jgi:hypothetical protein